MLPIRGGGDAGRLGGEAEAEGLQHESQYRHAPRRDIPNKYQFASSGQPRAKGRPLFSIRHLEPSCALCVEHDERELWQECMRTSFFAALFVAAGIGGANAQPLVIDDDYMVGPPAVVVPAAPVIRPHVVVVRPAPVIVVNLLRIDGHL